MNFFRGLKSFSESVLGFGTNSTTNSSAIPRVCGTQITTTKFESETRSSECPILDAQFHRAAGWGIVCGSKRPLSSTGRIRQLKRRRSGLARYPTLRQRTPRGWGTQGGVHRYSGSCSWSDAPGMRHSHSSRLSICIRTETTPPPLIRFRHQPSPDWISMEVFQLLYSNLIRPDIDIVISGLPYILLGSSLRKPLLQNLDSQ